MVPRQPTAPLHPAFVLRDVPRVEEPAAASLEKATAVVAHAFFWDADQWSQSPELTQSILTQLKAGETLSIHYEPPKTL